MTWHLCKICNFKTKYRNSLKYHSLSKHSIRKQHYQCQACPYQTHGKYILADHIKTKHIPDHLINWYNCTVCSYKSKRHWHLRRHMKTRHISDNEIVWFICQICNIKLKHSNSLKYHMTSKHFMGDSKFSCNECIFCTTTAKRLNNHIRAKHSLKKHKK